MKKNRLHAGSAFSLVELSIVLVILGLLVGGILAGQALIRASELRSITTDSQRFNTAIQAFRDKYFALPGDMNNATKFWGTSATGGGGPSSDPPSALTFNGSGDGRILSEANPSPGVFAHHEPGAAWQMLANAGLIEGIYNGGTCCGMGYDANGNDFPAMSQPEDISSPRSKLGAAWWSLRYYGPLALSYANSRKGNALMLNSAGFCGNATYPGGSGVLKPEEMWNVDTKLDDGIPNSGNVIVPNSNAGQGGSGCFSTNGVYCMSSSATLWQYNLTATQKACAPVFYTAF